jgi:Asp-tRNA(Asn)/Glu-tRNA(Gln) amidotransferase B subunit
MQRGDSISNQCSSNLNNNVKLIQLASNYITSDLWGMVYGDVEFDPNNRIPSEAAQFAELIKMIGDNKITSRGAKDTLAIMYKEGGSPEADSAEAWIYPKK